jgi:outer membrane protein TolC
VQPFFLSEDKDLSHYVGVATEIDYPEICECNTDSLAASAAPLTLHTAQEAEPWDLSLEEVTRITLNNSEVMRQLGGQTVGGVIGASPETLTRTLISPVGVPTVYDPALVDSATGSASGSAFNGTGVEAALAEFDARLDSSVFWNKNRQPQNRNDAGGFGGFSPALLAQDLGQFTTGITKTAATGTTFGIRNNTDYEGNNLPAGPAEFNRFKSVWQTNVEATFTHPLLQGGGTEYNRIAGPFTFQQYAGGGINPIDGVMIARIRTDLTLADFEGGVRNLMRDVEFAYWDLYFRYRDLQAKMLGRDSALETWRIVHAKFTVSARGGNAAEDAQALSQYFAFRAQVELALTELLQAESNLRYIMGLPQADGRLIRPADEPTSAKVDFNWSDIHTEGLIRRVEIRKQKWEIKRRELELIAARNHLLPRLDAVGTYRYRGLGDTLIDPNGGGIDTNMNGLTHNEAGSNAFDELVGGDFPEWQLGLQMSVPIGYRREHSQVRHHEYLLARDRALLQTAELEVSHQLATAIRSLEAQYGTAISFFNQRVAAETEVKTWQVIYDAGQTTLDRLLDAQRQRATAESSYYQSLVNYNKMIMEVHYRKGSALDYNGVYLAEGPWPGKAYFDALRLARQRDASMYLDYGFTQPGVVSRGSHQQTYPYGFSGDSGTEFVDGELIGPEMAPPEGGDRLPAPAGDNTLPPPPEEYQLDDALPQPLTGPPTRLPSVADAVAGQHVVLPVSYEQPIADPPLWHQPAPISPHALNVGMPIQQQPQPIQQPQPLPQPSANGWQPMPTENERQTYLTPGEAAATSAGWQGIQR